MASEMFAGNFPLRAGHGGVGRERCAELNARLRRAGITTGRRHRDSVTLFHALNMSEADTILGGGEGLLASMDHGNWERKKEDYHRKAWADNGTGLYTCARLPRSPVHGFIVWASQRTLAYDGEGALVAP